MLGNVHVKIMCEKLIDQCDVYEYEPAKLIGQ